MFRERKCATIAKEMKSYKLQLLELSKKTQHKSMESELKKAGYIKPGSTCSGEIKMKRGC